MFLTYAHYALKVDLSYSSYIVHFSYIIAMSLTKNKAKHFSN